MEPTIPLFFFRVGLETRALWDQGDEAGAKAMVKKNDLLNKLRYADDELAELLGFWSSLSDEEVATYPLLEERELADRAALWALIESRYDALVEAGKAPPRGGTEVGATEPAAEEVSEAAPEDASEPAAEEASEPAAEETSEAAAEEASEPAAEEAAGSETEEASEPSP